MGFLRIIPRLLRVLDLCGVYFDIYPNNARFQLALFELYCQGVKSNPKP